MAQWRQLLSEAGCTSVVTYINSGNAVFDSESPITAADIEQQLQREFGFEVPTLLFTGEEIIRIAESIPADWQNDYTDNKSDVLYLFDPVDTPEVLDLIGYRPEIETHLYVGRAVLTTISRKNQSRGSVQRLIGTKLYQQMTVRNITTARKLAELAATTVR